MPIGDICVPDVVTCSRDTKIDEVAQLMRQHHVGDVVVTEESKGKTIPVGIITDRAADWTFDKVFSGRIRSWFFDLSATAKLSLGCTW